MWSGARTLEREVRRDKRMRREWMIKVWKEREGRGWFVGVSGISVDTKVIL